MVTSSLVSGAMVWLMVRASIYIEMDRFKRVNGYMTNNMVMEQSTGSTTQDTKVNILEDKNMGLVTRLWPTGPASLVIGKRIKRMASVALSGVTAGNTKVIGNAIRWKDKES